MLELRSGRPDAADVGPHAATKPAHRPPREEPAHRHEHEVASQPVGDAPQRPRADCGDDLEPRSRMALTEDAARRVELLVGDLVEDPVSLIRPHAAADRPPLGVDHADDRNPRPMLVGHRGCAPECPPSRTGSPHRRRGCDRSCSFRRILNAREFEGLPLIVSPGSGSASFRRSATSGGLHPGRLITSSAAPPARGEAVVGASGVIG